MYGDACLHIQGWGSHIKCPINVHILTLMMKMAENADDDNSCFADLAKLYQNNKIPIIRSFFFFRHDVFTNELSFGKMIKNIYFNFKI